MAAICSELRNFSEICCDLLRFATICCDLLRYATILHDVYIISKHFTLLYTILLLHYCYTFHIFLFISFYIICYSILYTILFFTVKENDKTTIGLIKQACPHLLIEHGNQGLDSTGKFLTTFKTCLKDIGTEIS